MYLNQIVLIAATILNLNNVVKYIENKTVSGKALEEVDKLTRLTNLVISELAVMEIYIIRSQARSVSNGTIVYTALRAKPIKIFGVYDDEGNEYEFTAYPEYIKTDNRVTNITYAYACNEGLDEKITFSDYRITPDLIALGVAAEYLLTLNDFEGAIKWHEKFTEGLCALKTPKAVEQTSEPKNVTIKERSFI
ncbi:MAG: hypothetical protein IKB98_10405 [Clostridia bacterium]|nr:hypothetical protein [Clostridia bacterium]